MHILDPCLNSDLKVCTSICTCFFTFHFWERSGSVVECCGRGFEPHRRHCVVVLEKDIYPSLILVQPRKTRPCLTERLLMGRTESNQTNKQITFLKDRKTYIGFTLTFRYLFSRNPVILSAFPIFLL